MLFLAVSASLRSSKKFLCKKKFFNFCKQQTILQSGLLLKNDFKIIFFIAGLLPHITTQSQSREAMTVNLEKIPNGF